MKTAKKRISIICVMLCFVMLLVSCNQLTMSAADANNTPEDVSSKVIIEESSKNEESKSGISTVEESKTEESKAEENPSEEPSEAEPDYVVELTEEMANAFLKLSGFNITVDSFGAERNDPNNTEYYKKAYTAYGDLNGYTLCSIASFLNGFEACALYTYKAGEYEFTSGYLSIPYELGLYLYKDLTFITFEEAYKSGLFDAKEAYELINAYSGPTPSNPILAKKTSD